MGNRVRDRLAWALFRRHVSWLTRQSECLGYWSGLRRAYIFPPVLQNKATISTIIFLLLEEAAGVAELSSTSSGPGHRLARAHTATQELLP